MVKNTTGGSKHKKQKNSSIKAERPLILKQDDNEGYGQVMSFLGGSMVMIRKLGSQIEFRCRLRKSLPKIVKKDIVLYAIREFETKEVGDIILVYTSDEVHTLKREKYIDEEIEEDEVFGDNNENTLQQSVESEEIDINEL
jgi:initiation factor 1A